MKRRYLIIALAAVVFVAAGTAVFLLRSSGPLNRSQIKLVDKFTTTLEACNDIKPDNSHFRACKDAETLKRQIDAGGICIDYRGERQSYQGFYRCGEEW